MGVKAFLLAAYGKRVFLWGILERVGRNWTFFGEVGMVVIYYVDYFLCANGILLFKFYY